MHFYQGQRACDHGQERWDSVLGCPGCIHVKSLTRHGGRKGMSRHSAMVLTQVHLRGGIHDCVSGHDGTPHSGTENHQPEKSELRPWTPALDSLRESDACFIAISNVDFLRREGPAGPVHAVERNGLSQLPKLEAIMVGHNSVSQPQRRVHCWKVLFLQTHPVTRLDLNPRIPTLSIVDLASAKACRRLGAAFPID